jgi:chromosome segregation ATPase
MASNIPIEYDNAYLSTPKDRIVAVIESAENTEAAKNAFAQAGMSGDDVVVFKGQRAADKIDVSGEEHGVAGMVARTLQNMGDEKDYFYQKIKELQQGHNVLSVAVKDDAAREQAIALLKQHGGRAMVYHGSWVVEVIPD